MLPQAPSCPLSSFGELLSNSEAFSTPLRTTENRISAIVARSPGSENVRSQIFDDAINTRIIVHRRVLNLICEFLDVKIKFGSCLEQDLYTNMETRDFIRRLILKRPLVFVGPSDYTVGRDGRVVQNALHQWPLVGKAYEENPLLLKDYLSYDEIAIAALIGVSSPTYFINSGARGNMGIAGVVGEYTKRGVYVGVVGARFEIPDQMESRFLIANPEFCSAERGYGYHAAPNTHDQAMLQVWAKFYGAKDPKTGLFGFPVATGMSQGILNLDLYKKRIELTLETFLSEAEGRGQDTGRKVHAFVVGLGLGVWKYNKEQPIAYLDALMAVIRRVSLSYVEVVEVSWVISSYRGADRVAVPSGKENKEVTVILTRGEPAAKRLEDRLLVACYAWDGNAFPGNEIWEGSLSTSGDPAAVCCSTIGELQNPYVNPFSDNVYIVGSKPEKGNGQ